MLCLYTFVKVPTSYPFVLILCIFYLHQKNIMASVDHYCVVASGVLVIKWLAHTWKLTYYTFSPPIFFSQEDKSYASRLLPDFLQGPTKEPDRGKGADLPHTLWGHITWCITLRVMWHVPPSPSATLSGRQSGAAGVHALPPPPHATLAGKR